MNLRDIKTLRGIVGELKKYLDLHIEEDKKFISQIKKYKFLGDSITNLELRFDKIHKTIRKDLEKAYALSMESEKLIQQGKPSAKEINKIFPYLLSFDKLIFHSKKMFQIKFGLKSEYDYLTEFLDETEKKGFDQNLLNLIKARIMSLHKASSDERFMQIQMLKAKLSDKVISYFKVKRGLINFNRPKIREVIHIGSARVYLEIYFDKDLTDKQIGNLLESYINILSNELEASLRKNPSPVLAKIKSRVEQKARLLEDKNLKTIEELWLYQLKNMFVEILSKNQDLILTPSFRYQVMIKKDMGLTAFCDGNSRIDHYLFGIEISTLMIYYLISENFYEAFPASLFFQLKGTVSKKIAQDTKMAAYNYDAITISLSRIYQVTQNYRTFSLYSVYSHETEHAFDKKYLFKLNRLRPLLNNLIMESGFYKDHKTLNLSSGLLALSGFYLTCRQEAPTQFREFIVNHEAQLQQNEFYSLINPIPALGSRNILQDMNNIIKELENKSKSEKIIISGNYDITGLGYQFSHFMNMIIFFADCKAKNVDLVILDRNSLNKLLAIFPDSAPILTGHTGMKNIQEGTPEWFLLNSVKQGTNNQFIEILKRNNIPRLSLNDIPALLHNNIPFYIFRPSVNIMKLTLEKIQKSNEITYFEMYEKACNILNIPEADKLLSVNRVREFAEKLYQANALLTRKAGFHS